MSSEMLSADKYLSIVNNSLLRFLESRVKRKFPARFGGGRLETQVMLCAGRLLHSF
jgi:hypothetical protein